VEVESAGHVQICISPQTDNHASISHHSVFYRPGALPATYITNSVKALKARIAVLLQLQISKANLLWRLAKSKASTAVCTGLYSRYSFVRYNRYFPINNVQRGELVRPIDTLDGRDDSKAK